MDKHAAMRGREEGDAFAYSLGSYLNEIPSRIR
jgi:hypothetical protein